VRKVTLFLAVPLLSACASTAPQIQRLSPAPITASAPPVCKLASVMPDSPAQKAGLKLQEKIIAVNGAKPADASGVAELVEKSGPEVEFDVINLQGKGRKVKIPLNKERPRLGATCDLTGWRKSSVTAAGNEAVTEFIGPYAVTFSGIMDKGLAFMRLHVSNYSDKPLPIDFTSFTARDNQGPIKVLMPAEAIYVMHGEDAVPLIKYTANSSSSTVDPHALRENSGVRQVRPSIPHKKKADWSRAEELFIQSNADYLSKESLWPQTIPPGGVADGLIYLLEPKSLPLSIDAQLNGHLVTGQFGMPRPSAQKKSEKELVEFFNAQKKGAPVRLTLRSGKVFVGRFASYDSLNETVWFNTPSGVLLTTSSFGLRAIANAEAITPEQ
jgi:hypothetical protein